MSQSQRVRWYKTRTKHIKPLKKKNNLLNHIHERALRVIDQYYNSYFIELLRKDSSLKTYQGKLNVLVTEMLKVKVAPDIMKEIFEI